MNAPNNNINTGEILAMESVTPIVRLYAVLVLFISPVVVVLYLSIKSLEISMKPKNPIINVIKNITNPTIGMSPFSYLFISIIVLSVLIGNLLHLHGLIHRLFFVLRPDTFYYLELLCAVVFSSLFLCYHLRY